MSMVQILMLFTYFNAAVSNEASLNLELAFVCSDSVSLSLTRNSIPICMFQYNYVALTDPLTKATRNFKFSEVDFSLKCIVPKRLPTVSLSLSYWYPGTGVVLDCIDS